MKKVSALWVLFIAFACLSYSALAKDITIGVTTITLQHQFFIDIDEGIKSAAKERGVKVMVNDPNQDAAKQMAAIEDFEQKGVDGMIVISIDGVTAIPAIEDAAENMPIVTIDAVVKSDSVTSHIGTVNEVAGFELGKFAKDYIAENSPEGATIGIVTFLESPIQQERIEGFKRGLEGSKNITFLNPLPGYDREEALNTTEAMLQANPDLDYIFATAENGVIGVKAALESSENNSTKIFGFDLTEESAEGIRSGTILGMIQQQPFEMGRIATNILLDSIEGKKVEKLVPTPVLLYHKGNIAEYN